MKFLYQPVKPFNLTQLFGEDKCCVDTATQKGRVDEVCTEIERGLTVVNLLRSFLLWATPAAAVLWGVLKYLKK